MAATVKKLQWTASPVYQYKGLNFIRHTASYHGGQHGHSLYQYADSPEDACVYVGNNQVKVSVEEAKAEVQRLHEEQVLSDLEGDD